MVEYLSRQILVYQRQYFIRNVKLLLEKGLIAVAGMGDKSNKFLSYFMLFWTVLLMVVSIHRYPEPTRENVLEPNSFVLLNKRDKFFTYYKNRTKMALMQAIWKIFIVEYEHDPRYRNPIQWVVEELVESVLSGEWKARRYEFDRWWEEPPPYGGYKGRKFAQFVKTNR